MRRRVALVAALGLLASRPAGAQLAELHLGPVVTYGAGHVYGPGGGLVVGLAAGRLTYVGARWTWFGGATVRDIPPQTTVSYSREVRSRAQIFAVDLGVLVPKGSVEIIPSVSVGVVRFAQRARLLALSNGSVISESRNSAVEFLIAPGIAMEMRGGGFAIIPEVLWSLAGDPDVPSPAANRGPLVTVRVVRMLEIGRVRR